MEKEIKMSFRVNARERQLIKKRSKDHEMNTSEYIRHCIFEKKGDSDIILAAWAQDIQEISNILEEYKIKDSRIERLKDELWHTIIVE